MASHLKDGSLTAEHVPFAAGDGAPAQPGGPRRRRVAAVVLTAALLAAIAVVIIVALGSGASPGPAGSGTAVPAGEVTATVSRRTLTESTTVDGTLGYKGSYQVYDRLAEAGTFTWLPAAGSVIRRGGTLFRENNLPVVLMYGGVPAYRTLAKGVSNGPDVSELNRNLIELGYDPDHRIGDRAHFGAGTAAAVRRWQKSQGLPRTGRVELGRIVFASSSQRITKVDVALGQDPPGATEAPTEEAPTEPTEPTEEAPTETTEAEAPVEEPSETAGESPTEASGETPTTTTPATRSPTKPKSEKHKSPRKPRSETHRSPKSEKEAAQPGAGSGEPSSHGSKPRSQSPSSPSKQPEGSNDGEEVGGAGMLVLGTTSVRQIVQVQLKADEQKLARAGESAPVTLPSGRIVHGRITEVGTVASEGSGEPAGQTGEPEGSGNGEDATVPVTLALEHPVAHLDEAPVSVELVESLRRDVLTVPATALTATAGGGYAIEVLEGRHHVELPVTPGMFADGYVQVEGRGLRAGMIVLESE